AAGPVGAHVVRRALQTVVARRAVLLGRAADAQPRRGIAGPRGGAGRGARALDRRAALAHAGLAGVRLRAGIAVAARRAVRQGRDTIGPGGRSAQAVERVVGPAASGEHAVAQGGAERDVGGAGLDVRAADPRIAQAGLHVGLLASRARAEGLAAARELVA